MTRRKGKFGILTAVLAAIVLVGGGVSSSFAAAVNEDTYVITVTPPASVVYTGNPIVPTIAVALQSAPTTPLTVGTDYTVGYGANGNVNVGDVFITISGDGTALTGDTTLEVKSFTITGKTVLATDITVALYSEEMTAATYNAISSFAATLKTPATPQLSGLTGTQTFKFNGAETKATLANGDVVALTLDIAAGGNFLATTGIAIGSITINDDERIDISTGYTAAVTGFSKEYDGTGKTATSIVISPSLTESDDYTVGYGDDLEDDWTNATPETGINITITGVNNGTTGYKGSFVALQKFIITKRTPTADDFVVNPDFTSTVTMKSAELAEADALTVDVAPTLSGLGEPVFWFKLGEAAATSTKPTANGTYTVTVGFKAGDNFTALAATAVTGSLAVGTLEIDNRVDLAGATITLASDEAVYTGGALKPTIRSVVTSAANGSVTVAATAYDTAITLGTGNAAQTDAGTYTVTITPKSGTAGSGYKGSATKVFTITQAKLTDRDFTTSPALSTGPVLAVANVGTFTVTANLTGGKALGGTPTLTKYFNGVGTNPTLVGDYHITLDVTGATNYEDITGLDLGWLTLNNPGVASSRTNPTMTTQSKFTWGAAPTTAPVYGSTFSFTRPALVSGAGVGVIDSIWYNPGNTEASALPVRIGTGGTGNANTTNPTITANKAGKHKLTTFVRTRMATAANTADVPDSVFYQSSKTVEITVVEKAIAATWLKVNSKHTYTGVSQIPLIDLVVMDGTKQLELGTDYNDLTAAAANTLSGKGTVVVRGIGNYSGSPSAQYDIAKAPLTFNETYNYNLVKNYDGTNALDTSATGFVAQFEGIQNGEDFVLGRDYTLTNTRYPSADITDYSDVTGTVALIANGKWSQHYTLNPGTTNFTLRGGEIHEVAFAAKHLNYTVPTNHFENGSRRGIGTVTWKGVSNGANNNPVVYYTYTSDKPLTLSIKNAAGTADSLFVGDTTIAPTKAGVYPVTARIKAGTNFTVDQVISLKTVNETEYEIKAADVPSIDVWNTSVYTRKGVSTTLTVEASSPNGGQLTYRWFRGVKDVGQNTLISGQAGKSYTFTPGTTDNLSFFVEVTNRVSGVQINAACSTEVAVVEVDEAPESMNGATIVIADGVRKIYSGSEQVFSGEELEVRMPGVAGGDPWVLDRDLYDLTITNGVNAGTAAVVRATGKPLQGYSGSVIKTFTIEKKVTDNFDFQYVAERTYGDTGIERGAFVRPLVLKDSVGGMGARTVKYNGSTTVPTTAGVYSVEVTVDSTGKNYTAGTDIFICTYEIKRRTLVAKDLDYVLGMGKYEEGVAHTINVPVTIKKEVGGETFTGKLTTLYGGLEELPIDINTYMVSVIVEGDDNFESTVIDLGIFEIAVSIADIAREVPGSVVDPEAAVKPIEKVSADFTVGPSPAKAGESVKVFYGKAVKSGTVYVYASNGKQASKVAVKAGAAGAIATVKAPAAEGTYLAKGVLVGKDGKKEKVSFLFVVVK